MHDIRAIRDDPALFDHAMARRRPGIRWPAGIVALDTARRAALTELGERQARRNALAKQIGPLKRSGGDTAALEERSGQPARCDGRARISRRRRRMRRSTHSLAGLPNILDADVPDGADETANIEEKQVGEPPASFAAARQHFELGEALGMMDFAAATKLAGVPVYRAARRRSPDWSAPWASG